METFFFKQQVLYLGSMLMILIVASNKDVASQNIAEQILQHYSFEKTAETFQQNPVYEANLSHKKVQIVTLNNESVYAQNITDFFPNSELILFVSRHSSISGTPTLSVHTPGNLGKADLGGLPRKVSVSPANAIRNALKAMARLKNEMQLNYEVSYECTHHGPSLDVPTMFVELGSSPKQWSDLRAAEAIAHSAIAAISCFGISQTKAVMGIGGPHYNNKFTKLALEKEIAFGHIIPKYAFPNVDLPILKQCAERTLEKVEFAVLDWKGIKGEHKPKLIEILEEMGLPFEKV
ncbi:MAG: D-aminoacyl-tRNA deacylase [Candidatus Bathyarchaeota archaeon]|nr:D-aminoacyl-tRNA deacylase [Candidatus Bathyarchaeota archaeon]